MAPLHAPVLDLHRKTPENAWGGHLSARGFQSQHKAQHSIEHTFYAVLCSVLGLEKLYLGRNWGNVDDFLFAFDLKFNITKLKLVLESRNEF